MPFLFDQYYFILVIPALLISMLAQMKVKSAFAKYSKVYSLRDNTSNSVVDAILRRNDIRGVVVGRISGHITDHYDPRDNSIKLSDSVYGSNSIAAIGVAAHEAGHAIQHNKRYAPIIIRKTLVPIANIGSRFGPILAFVGLMFFEPLVNIGIILFSAAVLFYLVTLPVEIDASRRAVSILSDMGTFTDDEIKGVKKVLTAAALTYVAAAVVAMANLLRLILLSRGRRRY